MVDCIESDSPKSFYRSVDDPRGFLEEFPDPRLWRIHLREKLFKDRKAKSDLTHMPLVHSFDMHESLYSRKYVGKQDWQYFLFASPNVMLLRMEEHIPEPPSRVTAFWISVALHGFDKVQRWLGSLPFKSRPDTPWVGTNGYDTIALVADQYDVAKSWYSWFDQIKKKIDIEA